MIEATPAPFNNSEQFELTLFEVILKRLSRRVSSISRMCSRVADKARLPGTGIVGGKIAKKKKIGGEYLWEITGGLHKALFKQKV